MPAPLHLISSMATRQVLADLVGLFERAGGERVQVESVGGVDAARRVQAGEVFDGVVLAANAIDELIEAGRVRTDSRLDLVRSGVAVAVRAGAPAPDIGSEQALRAAVLAARSIGTSTGPSGVQLAQQFERWGISGQLAGRIVVAPPGVPVGQLVAEGKAELGFQQLSELMKLPGITLLGALPPAIQIVTIFSCGVATTCQRPEATRRLLAFMASPACAEAKRANGMDPA